MMWVFMVSLSDGGRADVIAAFGFASRCLGTLFDIDSPYFEQVMGQICPTEKQVAQWATIAHHGASIMFGDTISYDNSELETVTRN